MTPSLNLTVVPGRIVHYVLNQSDVEKIKNQRKDVLQHSGHLTIQGNGVSEGDHVVMVIVKVWPDEFGKLIPGVNGHCLLDGIDQHWVTSVKYSDNKEPGTWHWMEQN